MTLLYMQAFSCDFPHCDGFLVGESDYQETKANRVRREIRDRYGWKTISAGGIRLELCQKHPKAQAASVSA